MGTGTCDQGFFGGTAHGLPPGQFGTVIHGEGTCHVTVSFVSGAPDFVSDVQTKFGCPCCTSVAYPNPDFIDVPEIGAGDAGADVDAPGDTRG